MRRIERIALGAVLGGVLGMLSGPAPAGAAGEVLSAAGTARAEGADGPRVLACGSPVAFGERIATGPDGSAGLVLEDVWVQLAEDARVELAGDAAAPVIRVRAGRVRVTDTREAGAPALTVRTPHLEARGAGLDAELHVAGDRTEVCERGAGLTRVRAGQADRELPAGRCAEARPGAALALRDAGAPRVALGAEGCIEVAVVEHFLPGVAAPPPTQIGLMPIDPDRTTYRPCDSPGSGCAGIHPAPLPSMPSAAPSPGPPPNPGFPPDQGPGDQTDGMDFPGDMGPGDEGFPPIQ